MRILAVHALRHGMVRPLWLVDLAVATECRSADFDWRRCLGPDRRRGEWVVAAITLAHQLLGADVTGSPIPAGTPRIPSWLSSAVLRAWGRGAGDLSERPPAFHALIGSVGDGRRFSDEWRLRWDRPDSGHDRTRCADQRAASFAVSTRHCCAPAPETCAHGQRDGA